MFQKSRDNREASKGECTIVLTFSCIAFFFRLFLVFIYIFDLNFDTSDKKKDSAASGQSGVVKKEEKDSIIVKEETEEKPGVSNNNKIAKVDASDIGEDKNEKKLGETATGQITGSVKTVKKKVIKKVVKPKGAIKANDSATQQMDKSGVKDAAEEAAASDVPNQEDKSSVDPTRIHTSDVSTGKTDGEEGKGKEINSSGDKPQDNPDPTVNAVTNDVSVKITKKRKIIKRVPKKKVVGEASKSAVSDPKNEGNVVEDKAVDGNQSTGKQTAAADAIVTEPKKSVKVVPKKKLKTPTSGKQGGAADSNKAETKSDKKDEGNVVAIQAKDESESSGKQPPVADTKVTPEVKKTVKVVPKKKLKAPASEKQGTADSNKTEMKPDKDDKGTGEKSGAKTDKQKTSEKSPQNVKEKQKDGDKSGEKVTKGRDGKVDPKSKSSKEVKEKRKSEEPPRHPGYILQTKGTKDSKVSQLEHDCRKHRNIPSWYNYCFVYS